MRMTTKCTATANFSKRDEKINGSLFSIIRNGELLQMSVEVQN